MADNQKQVGKGVRSVVEERLAAAAAESGPKETMRIEWRTSHKYLPVITMPIDALRYNPGTHRIRAQRSLDATKDAALNDDPYGQTAQSYLHNLLQGDPKDPSQVDSSFEALKTDLAEHGQNEPGIITRDGVLINGNTRRAALRELNQDEIRVAVLPPDAGHSDTRAIELALQLRKDHKRDYTFMNFLLAIDERESEGANAVTIQKEFRIRASTFDRSIWILQFIKDAIDRSTVELPEGTISMRMMDFEDHQGKLEELYRSYINLKPKNPDEADSLREQRLLALVLNKSKTDLRLIESDFSEKYMTGLMNEMQEQAQPVKNRKIPGMQIIAKGPSKSLNALRSATDAVLKARTIQVSAGKATPGLAANAGETMKKFETAMERALDLAGKHGRVTKKRFAPADRLSDANDHLEQVVNAVAEAKATSNFDPLDLDDGLRALRNTFGKLSRQVVGLYGGSAEGLEWLQLVAEIQDESK